MSQHLDFPARLRIKSRKDIELLFENDQSFFSHPLVLKFQVVKNQGDTPTAPQFTVSVPKKNFRKANVRNLLKRRIREAYRLNWRNYLSESNPYKFLLMFILVGKNIPEYNELEKSVKQLLSKVKSDPNNFYTK